MKKTSNFLIHCFCWMASLSFTYVFVMAFFWNRQGVFPLLAGFSVFFLLLAGLCITLCRNGDKLTALLEDPRSRFFLVAFLLVLYGVLTGFSAHQLMRDTTQELWDVWVVQTSSAFVAEHPFAPLVQDIAYFQRYENNQFILAFVSLWFILCRFIFGSVNYEICSVVLCVGSLCASMGFTYLAAKNFFGVKTAFATLVSWFFFLPFYSYSVACYTDTLSLPFITLTAFLLSLFYKTRRLFWLVPAGLVLGLGTRMKGTLLVFAAACVIWLFLMDHTSFFKRIASVVLCVSFLFAASQGFSLFYQHSGLFGESPTDREGMAIPVTHWLMMGQNPDGPYVQSDVDFSITAPGGYKARAKICWDVFRGRLITRGLVTDLIFTNRKVVETWGEGSYQTSLNVQNLAPLYPDSFLRKVMTPGGEFSKPYYLFCNIFHFSLLAAMLGTLLSRLIFKKFAADGLFLFQLSLFGMFLFELFWEWRARYLLSYVPFLLCMLPLGICAWVQIFSRIFRRFQKSKPENS